jgi:hypothetical protein
MPATGILTWHDQNRENPSTNPDLDGIEGVEEFIRFCAHYAANGRYNREGPRLQLLTMDEAMSKTTTVAHLDGGVLGIPNIKLEPDSLYRTTIPWGYAPACSTVWADSSWTYVNRDDANVADGWFGYFDDTGLFATDANADDDGGTDTPFHQLIQVYPVIPGSRVRVGCYASASRLLETGSETDLYSACYIDIEATPFQFDFDYTDSLDAWVYNALTSSDFGFTNINILDPPNVYKVSAQTGGPSDSLRGYSEARIQRRFHKRDSWEYQRTQSYSGTFYSNSTLANSGDEYVKRWREFNLDFVVPWDCYWVRVKFVPTGWTDATSDSLALLPYGPFMSPR